MNSGLTETKLSDAIRAGVGANPVNAGTKLRDVATSVVVPILIPPILFAISRTDSRSGFSQALDVGEVALGFTAIGFAITILSFQKIEALRRLDRAEEGWNYLWYAAVICIAFQVVVAAEADSVQPLGELTELVIDTNYELDVDLALLDKKANEIHADGATKLQWLVVWGVGGSLAAYAMVMIVRES